VISVDLDDFPAGACGDLAQLAFLIRCRLVGGTDPKIERTARFIVILSYPNESKIITELFSKEVIFE
jgi:hypothetical protein